MDRTQLIKILGWNVSVDPEIEIDKVIDCLKGFPTIPYDLINELRELKKEGVKKVDRFETIQKIEKL